MSQYNNDLKLLYQAGYRVNSSGEVINGDRIIGTQINKEGYITFKNKRKGRTITIFVHRMQAFQKYGEELFCKGIETRHKNGIKKDNSFDNIVIGTHSQNMMDIPKEIRIKKAKNAVSFMRRFTHGEAEQIRKINSHGISYKRLAKAYKTCKSTLSYIINNKTYAL